MEIDDREFEIAGALETHRGLDNVFSTSPQVPGFAYAVPLDETVDVRGVVFDAGGRPAGRAEVWAACSLTRLPHRERVFADAEGRFLLHLKPFANERWSIRAYQGAQGGEFADNQGWLDVDAARPARPIEIRLSERGTVNGKVVAADSNDRLADARLYLSDGRIVITDKLGRYTIGGLPRGGHKLVAVAAGRERLQVLFDNSLRETAELDISLKKGGRVEGQVVDERQQPVPFAWVRLPASTGGLSLSGLSTVCDKYGTFVWDGIPIDFAVRPLEAGHESLSSPPNPVPTIGRAEPQRIVFELKPDRELAGRDFAALRTAAQGQGGRNHAFRDAGGGSTNDGGQAPGSAAVRGRVIDPEGRPVRDFRIQVELSRQTSAAISSAGATRRGGNAGVSFTDGRGEFAFSGLVPGTAYTVSANSAGFSGASADGVRAQPVNDLDSARYLELQLTPTHSVSICVVDARSGLPLSGAAIFAAQRRTFHNEEAHSWNYDEYSGPAKHTDDRGWARFPEFPSREATFAVRHPGYAQTSFRWTGTGNDEDFVVRLEPQSVVKVNVALRPTQKLMGGWLILNGLDQQIERRWSVDSKLSFVMGELPAGKYHVRLVDRDGLLAAREVAVTPAETRELELKIDLADRAAMAHNPRAN
jgi:hypothetical protein